MAYELLEKITVGSGGTSSLVFSNIPQDGTHLVVKLSARSNSNSFARSASLRLNGAGSYEGRTLTGDGDTVIGQQTYFPDATEGMTGANTSANAFGNAEWFIPNYSASNIRKMISVDGVAPHQGDQGGVALNSALTLFNDAVTSIEFVTNLTYLEHTTVSLYKIS